MRAKTEKDNECMCEGWGSDPQKKVLGVYKMKQI